MSVLPKNKKVAAGIGVAAAAAAVLALGAGTYAAFTDTESGPGGTFAAGTLDLVVTSAPTTTPIFNATDITPGYASAPYTLSYRNAGSIPGNLSLSLGVTNAENDCTEPEGLVDNTCTGTAGELGGALLITVTGPGITYSGSIDGLAGGPTPVGALAPGATAQYQVSYSLPQDTGNQVQSDGVLVNASAVLAQQ